MPSGGWSSIIYCSPAFTPASAHNRYSTTHGLAGQTSGWCRRLDTRTVLVNDVVSTGPFPRHQPDENQFEKSTPCQFVHDRAAGVEQLNMQRHPAGGMR